MAAAKSIEDLLALPRQSGGCSWWRGGAAEWGRQRRPPPRSNHDMCDTFKKARQKNTPFVQHFCKRCDGFLSISYGFEMGGKTGNATLRTNPPAFAVDYWSINMLGIGYEMAAALVLAIIASLK
ncbi:unnamed protein product [Aphanomyces euteiches]